MKSKLVKAKDMTEKPVAQDEVKVEAVKIEKDIGDDNKEAKDMSQVKVLGTVCVPSGVRMDMGPLVKFSGENFGNLYEKGRC